MPSKNRVKQYAEDGYYHVYNRGVEKRITFLDNQDYVIFLYLLKLYLSPSTDDISKTVSSDIKTPRIKQVFFGEVELYSFCLMPNHFHLLIHQIDRNSMTQFMRALITSYVMYFNKKYKRVGNLFQGIYKASLVTEDSYILHLSRYIHANPLKSFAGSFAGSDPAKLKDYPYSSYPFYLGNKHADWINTKFILSFFEEKDLQHQVKLYQDFVENYSYSSDELPDKFLLENPEE